MEADTLGFAGSVGVNLQITKNTKDILFFGGTAYVQYRNGKHLALFLNNTSFKKVNDAEIINKGTNHLRYNFKLNELITIEGLLQLQYNSISKIDQRQLAGGGLRFRLAQKEKYKLFLGTIFMFEHEKINNPPVEYNDDIRFSGYLSLRYFPADNITFASTTFYQPRIDKFNDYRIYSYNSLSIRLIKKLSLKITYALSYDTHPAQGIPKTQYDLLNGIVYVFN
jgi:putative salt-induced outer membrane protein YdiY